MLIHVDGVVHTYIYINIHIHVDGAAPSFQRERGLAGRQPSTYESRAAFLMLFGDTHHLTLRIPGKKEREREKEKEITTSGSRSNGSPGWRVGGGGLSVAVTIAGVKGRALLVQRLGVEGMAVEEESEGDARVGAEAVALFGFIQDAHVRLAAQEVSVCL